MPVYQWQINDGGWQDISGANSASYTTETLNEGTYEFRLNVAQASGCDFNSSEVTVTVLPDAIVDIEAVEIEFCAGGIANFTSTVIGGSGTPTYQWQRLLAGGWTSISGANSATYTSPSLAIGTYTYRLLVDQDAGCSSISDTVVITVVDDPTIIVTVDDADICENGTATLTAIVVGGSGVPAYQWQRLEQTGWQIIPGATAESYSTGALPIGTYNYRVRVTQGSGCSVTSSPPATVTVEEDPDITVSVDDIEICDGGTVTLTASVSGNTDSTSYVWQILDIECGHS